jgi:hypothetical protein
VALQISSNQVNLPTIYKENNKKIIYNNKQQGNFSVDFCLFFLRIESLFKKKIKLFCIY